MNLNLKSLSFVALLAIACSTVVKEQPVPPAGTVLEFTASPGELAMPGDKATLKWKVENATAVSLEQVGKGPIQIDAKAQSGSVDVVLAKDTLFVLTARGEGGTDSASAGVRVLGGSSGLVFDAVPRSIGAGQFTTLVWSAPGATAVAIKDLNGAAVELGGQKDSGSVRVGPQKSTTYELDADGKKLTVAVEVGSAIYAFGLSGPAPLPGAMAALTWETSGGTKLTLKRDGVAAPLLTELNPTAIVSGTFNDTVPASAPADGQLNYTLELEQGAAKVTKQLTVRIGGAVKIDSFTVPAYVRQNQTFVAQWKTTGAERLELFVDGALVYLAPDAATVAQGNRPVVAPGAGVVKTKLVVSNSRGAVAELEKTSTVIAPPVFNSFTSNPTSITNGGEPVTVSWDVTNARHVRISENGQTVYEANVTAPTGMATLFPNRATTTYVLEVDNQAGDSIMPKSLNVTVANPGILTFGAKLPVGAPTTITGHTVVGGTNLTGLPNVVKNAPGDAFVDISTTGNAIALTNTDTTATVVDIGPFSSRIFGRPVTGPSISVAPDGFINFSAVPLSGPTTPTFTAIGTQLHPLSIAPVLRDLVQGAGKIYWKVDAVGDEQRLIVQWHDVEQYLTSSAKFTFQLQVYSRGKVVFAYQAMAAGVQVAYGVVNGTETDVLLPAAGPVAGDVYTYFGETTALPVPVKVELVPYTALVKVAMGWVVVEGSGLLTPGQIAITEMNTRPPAAVTGGEWLEITNFTASPFDLTGWVIDVGTANTHTIGALVVPANGRVVLGQTADLGQPGAGVAADYVYGTVSPILPDTSGTIALSLGGTPYTRLQWDAVTAPTAGVAVRADRPNPAMVYASPLEQTVCPGTGGAQYGDAGEVGTPGQANPKCFPYTLAPTAGQFEPIASDGGTVVIPGDAGSTALEDKTYAVPVAAPVKYYGQSFSTLYVSTNGWITTTSTTVSGTTNKVLPSTTAPVGSIAPFWDDLRGNPAGLTTGIYTVRRDPDGTPANGDEYTIVSWEGWMATTGQLLNFQVKFFENGNIEYHFGPMVPVGSETTHLGSSATTWLEDPLGKSAWHVNLSSVTPGIQANQAFRYTYTP